MAIVGELINFLYGVNGTPSTKAGDISFDSGKQAIYVGDGSAANLVTSHVKDAKFESNKLTIEFVDASANIELDFTDVASTKGVMAVFEKLDTSIKSLDTRITNLDTYVDSSIKALDEAYKLADTSIRTDFAAADKAINDKIGTVAEGKTVVGLIEEAKAAANAAHSVVAKDSSFLTLNTSTAENGAITYTLGISGIASASALAEVKSTADAAAKQSDFNAHATDGDIHITAQERTDWNAAKSAIDTFLKDASLTGEVIDTLTEIQDYIASDASAADKLVKDLSDVSTRAEKGISDASVAQAAADKAQGEVDALEGVVSTLSGNFDTHSKDATIHITSAERTAWNAAEQNAKDYADSLASNYDKVGDASTAETAAKSYADAITVNGQAQSEQNIIISGLNILVGGTDYANDSTIAAAIADIDERISTVAETAGVKGVSVDANDANYASVSTENNVVTLDVKIQDVSTANESSTGLADAYETKQYVSFRISDILGTASDTSAANTVYGAKAHATALNTAMDERVTVVENQLKWQQLN